MKRSPFAPPRGANSARRYGPRTTISPSPCSCAGRAKHRDKNAVSRAAAQGRADRSPGARRDEVPHG